MLCFGFRRASNLKDPLGGPWGPQDPEGSPWHPSDHPKESVVIPRTAWAPQTKGVLGAPKGIQGMLRTPNGALVDIGGNPEGQLGSDPSNWLEEKCLGQGPPRIIWSELQVI